MSIWAGIASSVVGGLFSAFGASNQNKAAQKAAQAQMDFQREAAQNQYSWAMADMKRAGLNPILAYKQGGSGTLGGSSYTPVNVGAAAATGASQTASSAVALRRSAAETKNINEDTKLKSEQGATEKRKQINVQAQSQLLMQQRKLARQQQDLNLPGLSSAKAAKKFYDTSLGQKMRQIQLFMESIGLKSGTPGRLVKR